MKTINMMLVTLLVAGGAVAQTYEIDWHSTNSGGGVSTSGSYTLTSTVGQSAVGLVKNANLLHWVGFWSGEVPTPTVMPSLVAAKLASDDTFVSVAGKIAVSSDSDFDGFFYIEESDRSTGIRVAAPASAVAGLARGSVVNVIGTMAAAPSGERQISGSIVIIGVTGEAPGPLGMPNRSLGGSDLGLPPMGQYGVTGGSCVNIVGLLIRTWGYVTAVGSGYLEIDDGSGPVRVDTSTLVAPPAQDDYVIVTGVSSLYSPAADRLPVVLPRADGDVDIR